MIRLEYVFDEQTFLDAHRALWRRKRQSRRSRLFGYGLAVALPLSTWAMLQWGMFFTFLAVVAGNLLYWVFDWPLTRAVVRRGFARLPGANARFTWKIDEGGLEVRDENGEGGLIPWNKVEAAWEDEAGFVIAQPGNVTQWLPKAAFRSEADIARFRELLKKKGKRPPPL